MGNFLWSRLGVHTAYLAERAQRVFVFSAVGKNDSSTCSATPAELLVQAAARNSQQSDAPWSSCRHLEQNNAHQHAVHSAGALLPSSVPLDTRASTRIRLVVCSALRTSRKRLAVFRLANSCSDYDSSNTRCLSDEAFLLRRARLAYRLRLIRPGKVLPLQNQADTLARSSNGVEPAGLHHDGLGIWCARHRDSRYISGTALPRRRLRHRLLYATEKHVH